MLSTPTSSSTSPVNHRQYRKYGINKNNPVIIHYIFESSTIAFTYSSLGSYSKKNEDELLIMPTNNMKIVSKIDSQFKRKDSSLTPEITIKITGPTWEKIFDEETIDELNNSITNYKKQLESSILNEKLLSIVHKYIIRLNEKIYKAESFEEPPIEYIKFVENFKQYMFIDFYLQEKQCPQKLKYIKKNN